MSGVEYRTPAGEWVKPAVAKRLLFTLASRFVAVECRQRALWIEQNWERVASRPGSWREFELLVERFEGMPS